MDSPEEGTCGQSETSRFAVEKRGAAAREKEERKRARESESVPIFGVCNI